MEKTHDIKDLKAVKVATVRSAVRAGNFALPQLPISAIRLGSLIRIGHAGLMCW